MRVKIIITANIKKAKIGEHYGGYGINGRAGYWEEPIRKIGKNYIIVANKRINMKTYAYKQAMNNPRKKIKVKIQK